MTLTAREVVQRDLSRIHLGNLATVDTDIALPCRGELGTSLTWKSGQTLFISHEGKVTRPSHGIGNRTVELIVRGEFAGYSEERVYTANVLEEEYLAEILETFPVQLSVAPGESPDLPAVVVVRDDLNQYNVAPVIWDDVTQMHFVTPGVYELRGTVRKSGISATATVQVIEATDPGTGEKPGQGVRFFEGGEVTLQAGSPFAASRDRMVDFLLKVNDDQMLYSFRKAAGIDTRGALPMTGWDSPECKLRGHTTGHYLSALALAYANMGLMSLKEKLDYMVEELSVCQNRLSQAHEPGFLSAYSPEQFDLLEQYTRYPEIWAPYYTLHKIMAGLRDCFTLAGNDLALKVCRDLGLWVYRRLSRLPKEQLGRMWSMYIAGEFGGMNEVLADLHMLTGDAKFLCAARLFDNDKLFLPMEQDRDTLGTLHANQHIPQIIGALKLYKAAGEERYYVLAKNFWRMVTTDHMYSIGGTGETEMFRPPGVIGRLLTQKTAESCASYNMMKLSRDLFALSPEARYMDYYERAMYNHILSSADSRGATGGTTYFMPLAPASRKSFDTDENTCCHGTGLETQLKYHECIYARDDKAMYVNLYVPSAAEWQSKGVEVTIRPTDEEDDGRYEVHVSGRARFALKLRKPYWAGQFTLRLNGEAVAAPVVDGYCTLLRDWDNDTVTVDAPYSLRTEHAPDVAGLFSVFYGPYVLAGLHDRDDHLPVDPDGFAQDGPLSFRQDGVRFIPLAMVTDEKYHVYFTGGTNRTNCD